MESLTVLDIVALLTPHPLNPRSPSYVPPDALTVDAIQKCLPGWDGKDGNISVVFDYLRAAGRSVEEIDAMRTWLAVRNAFSTGQKVMLETVGWAHTNTNTIHLFDLRKPQELVKAEAVASGVDDLVGLDEAAAIVHRSKRTLERRLSAMPVPYVQGGGGKPSLWKWDDLRPWLESEYIPDLPKRFPSGSNRKRIE